MNVFSPVIFSDGAPCLPCCGGDECPCALLMYDYLNPPPPGGDPTPFASYADAVSFIASYVFDCLVTCGGATGTTATADFTASVLNVDATGTDIAVSTRPVTQWITSFDANSGDTVRVDFSSITTVGGDSGSGTLINAGITDCDGNFIDPTDSGADFVEWTLLANGPYQILVSVQGYESGTSVEAVSAMSCDGPLTINPLIALWDDSGTTRQLEACPKLYLPPLTESTGNWYVDETEAQTAIDDQSSNCVGFFDLNGSALDSFSATDGGTSIEWTADAAGGIADTGQMWASINAESGETLSLAFTGGDFQNFDIYDYDGVLVEGMSGASNPEVSSALPYTGRYIVKAIVANTSGPDPTTVTATVTSSGTLSVNPIQALYDVGLTCPARLDCA